MLGAVVKGDTHHQEKPIVHSNHLGRKKGSATAPLQAVIAINLKFGGCHTVIFGYKYHFLLTCFPLPLPLAPAFILHLNTRVGQNPLVYRCQQEDRELFCVMK
jgi:hypothetical protein